MQLSQPLSGDGKARLYAPAKERGVLNVSRFSDEAYFHLDGCINQENDRFWTSENLSLTVANPLHPDKVALWCAL
jgi:hypothetical protein